MKKLLTFLLLLLTFASYAQPDVAPTDSSYHNLTSYAVRYWTHDNSVWMYMGKYGSAKLARAKDGWYAKALSGTDTVYIHVEAKDTLNIAKYMLHNDSINLAGYFTNWKALQYRKLNNHDSLSVLDEKSYNSLTDKPNLTIYRQLNNHDSLSTLDEKAYASLTGKPDLTVYRQLNNHDSLSILDEKAYASLTGKPDLTVYTLKNDSSKYYEKLVNKSTNVTTDGASDVKYPSVKAVKTYADLKVALADSGKTSAGNYVTAKQLAQKRNLNDPDSLVHLEARDHVNLTNVLGRGSYHVSQAARDSINSSRQMGDTVRNVGSATVFDLTGKQPLATVLTNIQDTLNLHEHLANKSTTTTLGTSNVLYPTQNAVKVYADTKAPASGSTSYIQNQNSSAQTANLWINGKVQSTGYITGNLGYDYVSYIGTYYSGNRSYYSGIKITGSSAYNGSYYPAQLDFFVGSDMNVLTLFPDKSAAFTSTVAATQFNASSLVTTPAIKLASTTEGYVLKIHSDGSVYPDSPTSGSIYNGAWSAASNSPSLANSVGTTGSYYHCTASGTVDFGAGNITFVEYEDDVAYNGSIWQKIVQSQYSPVIATASNLGVVKIGSGVSVDGGGIISVSTAYDATGTATGAVGTHESTYNHTNYNTAYSQTRQWDGGSTGLVAATGRTSLGLVIGTDVLAYRTFGTAANSATGDFIQNQNASAQNANFNINGGGSLSSGGLILNQNYYEANPVSALIFNEENSPNESLRNWAIQHTITQYGDFAIRQSVAKGGDPITAGRNILYFDNTGAATFISTVTAASLVKSGGTSSQFLKADGSVDTNSYQTSGSYVAVTDTSTMLGKYARKVSPTFTGTVVLPSTTSIGTITNTELSYVDGVTSAIQTQFTGKENAITAGTTSQYWRGDKTWQTLPTAGTGTVTSVAMSVPTGLSISGTPITTSGTLAVTLTSGYVIPTTTNISTWNGLTTNATHSGDATGSGALTLATVNSNVGTYQGITVNAKGLVTAASNQSYQAALVNTTNIKSINGTTLLGSGDLSTTQTTVSGNAGTVTVANDNTTNTDYYPVWTAGAGSAALKISSPALTYNPYYKNLTVTGGYVFAVGLYTNTITSQSGASLRISLPTGNTGTSGQVLTSGGAGTMTWSTPSGGGSGMTWPASAGIAVYSGSSSWATSITNNSANWNTAYGWGNHATAGYATGTINNATLTLATSGSGISGSQTFTANQASGATFTVASNATTSNTAGTIVLRDGSGYVSLTGTFCSSDSTLKRNIRSLSKIDLYNASKIDLRKFWFKAENDQKNHFGVIAQDVQKLFPELINTSKETGKLEVNYPELSILLIAQQKEEIQLLKEQNRQLEKRIEKLEDHNKWEAKQINF